MKIDDKKRNILGFIIVGILFSIPSIWYLKDNNSIDGYNGTLYYFLHADTFKHTVLGTMIIALLLIASFMLYFKLIKNSKKFDIKKILILVFIVGFSFILALPNTSTDVFYYMGTGRLLEEYSQNPYYTTIGDMLKNYPEDLILRNSGPWMFTTSVYGPIWILISYIFNKICFGSITLLLYIFKFSALIVHVINCYIIYKITKKKIFSIVYGFNPLVLIEFLINAHNDIYLIFFVLLAIYFLKNIRNIWCSLLMLAISVGIKHITLILVPIFVLYYLQDNKFLKKIGLIILYAIFFILLIYIMYLPFINNVWDIFKIILNQQDKIKDSIYLLVSLITNKNMIIVSVIFSIMIFVVGYYYIILCLKLLLRKNSFGMLMKNTTLLLFWVIFTILTNLTSWYLTWFFVSMFWTKGKDIKRIIWIQFLYELTYVYLYFWHSDHYKLAVIVTPVLILGTIVREIYLRKNRNLIGSNIEIEK